MTNEEKIIASMEQWNKSEEDSREKWDKAMADSLGKEKFLKIRKKRYRNEEIKLLVKGTVCLTAVAILCVVVLCLR